MASKSAGAASVSGMRRSAQAAAVRFAASKSASWVTAADAASAPLWACTGLAQSTSNRTAHATAWSRMLRRRRITASADDGVLLEKRIGLGLRKRCFRGGRLRAVPIQLERKLQVCRLVSRELHRIHTGVARRAVLLLSVLNSAGQLVEARIREAVGLEILPDFFERVGRRNQLRPPRRVDAVEAWRDGRRAADAHVDFARASVPHHLHQLAARGAAHDGIVDEDDA